MLRLVAVGNSLPFSFPCDPNANFQPGQIAQLNVYGNQIVCGVSDGTCPIGIIDDINTKAFTAPSINEVVIAPAIGIVSGSKIVSQYDVKIELANPNIMATSFMSNPVDAELIPRNGVLVFPAGTELNFDMTGSGTPDSIRTVVSYIYQIPNIPGDSSVEGSGRITVWFQRGFYETDQFDTTQSYAINASLFCNEAGLFTTKQVTPNTPCIGICTASPNSVTSSLQFLWI